MKTLIYGILGSVLLLAVEEGLAAIGQSGAQRSSDTFNPKQRDPNRGVIVDGSLANANAIRVAYEGIGARVLVLKSPNLAKVRSGDALRELFEAEKTAPESEPGSPPAEPKGK